ncbi:MAG: acetyl-CoA C-acyltransferase, partial [Gemmatimonadetes bacterium]|nr:acetyl-CoA C-acyltransferase [Gemmatimonadota bacterium]NIU73493.1 acetyl-CoA C-acyltransferase [Gammaproteobacteria bacterium]NIQ53350.1 acetyl-CoA C-acyltransferase [Gemmatimonadota bacterium]NIV22640.1 acetyl-CoA C-acyltransferase [Gemmatimonadota bacterium]NIX43711.1 acetyl-CoA C-acyltransferase [Gemmatimonadota bacterium]
VVRGARWGRQLRLGPAGEQFEDLLWQALLDTNCDLTMAQTAEELADRYGVTREEADEVAVASQQRAKAAWDAGRFDAEIAEVVIETRKGATTYAADEHMRPETTMEVLA